jgi:DUF1009 family protein
MEEAEQQCDPMAKLGLIAGAGGLPSEAVLALGRAGHSVEVIGFEGVTEAGVALPENCLALGQLASLVAVLSSSHVTRLLIVGKFAKSLLLRQPTVISPDAEAIALLEAAGGWDDDGLIGLIAGWLETRGFAIERQDLLLGEMLAEAGPLSGRAPSDSEMANLDIGREVVEHLGHVGVGQCAAIREGCVIALEAVEGTDAMIRRAGELAGPGMTIVKSARPGQDRRFDLPAVGPRTLEEMQKAGATGLAVEAGSTLILDGVRFREQADAAGIAVWGFEIEAAGDRLGDAREM